MRLGVSAKGRSDFAKESSLAWLGCLTDRRKARIVSRSPPADALVLYGATGDLARKMLFPALTELSLTGSLDLPVIGVARSEWGDEGLRDFARASVTATEGVIEFHALPATALSPPDSPAPHPNHLRFRLGPDDGVTLGLEAKAPGEAMVSRPFNLSVDFEQIIGIRTGACERPLTDALKGDHSRFAREDGVEAAWRVVQPALDQPERGASLRERFLGSSPGLLREQDAWHDPHFE